MPEEGKAQLTWCWKWRSGFFSLSWSSILASRSLRSFVPLLSVFPSVSCSFLSFFFQPFPLVLEAGVGEEAVSGFLVSLSSSLRPFSLFCCVIPCFSGFFFFVPSLFSFVLSVYFFRVLPLSFFRSQSLSISPAGSPWLFRAPRFYSCFSFPRFCPFSLVFLPPVRGFFFSLLCFFEKKQRNASLLFFFLFPPSVLSLSLGVFLFSLF